MGRNQTRTTLRYHFKYVYTFIWKSSVSLHGDQVVHLIFLSRSKEARTEANNMLRNTYQKRALAMLETMPLKPTESLQRLEAKDNRVWLPRIGMKRGLTSLLQQFLAEQSLKSVWEAKVLLYQNLSKCNTARRIRITRALRFKSAFCKRVKGLARRPSLQVPPRLLHGWWRASSRGSSPMSVGVVI